MHYRLIITYLGYLSNMSVISQVVQSIKRKNIIKKVVIVGSGAVGKTSLLQILKMPETSILDEETKYTRTPFLNIDSKTIQSLSHNSVGHLQFYDLAGQIDLPIHALKDFSKQILGHTDIILMVFANDNLQSFLDLKMWYQLVNNGIKTGTNSKNECKLILVNNKIDLPSAIDESMIEYFLSLDKQFKGSFKISCLTKNGIDPLMCWIEEELFSS